MKQYIFHEVLAKIIINLINFEQVGNNIQNYFYLILNNNFN